MISDIINGLSVLVNMVKQHSVILVKRKLSWNLSTWPWKIRIGVVLI